MLPEEQLLFVCARQDFTGGYHKQALALAKQGNLRWDLVYQLADLHGVAPLIYRNLRLLKGEIHFPTSIAGQFEAKTLENVLVKQKRTAKLVEVLAFFQEKSIAVMLVKGAALDLQVYGAPWYTFTKDMDLVIHCRPDQLSEIELQQFHHQMFQKSIEYDFYAHHDITMNGVLPVDFDWIWKDAQVVEFHSMPLLLMSLPDLLISIAINSCRKRFLRLKSLVDIAETLARHPEMDWEAVLTKARHYGCSNILFTALLATEHTLGCQLPPHLLVDLMPSAMKRSLLTSVLHFLLSRKPLVQNASKNMSLLKSPLGLSLLLPYLTYNRRQLLRKVQVIITTRPDSQ